MKLLKEVIKENPEVQTEVDELKGAAVKAAVDLVMEKHEKEIGELAEKGSKAFDLVMEKHEKEIGELTEKGSKAFDKKIVEKHENALKASNEAGYKKGFKAGRKAPVGKDDDGDKNPDCYGSYKKHYENLGAECRACPAAKNCKVEK